MSTHPYASIDDFCQKQGAQSKEYQDICLPMSYAVGQTQELEWMLQGTGILDLKAGSLLQIQGPDAQKFLQGMVTNDIRLIPVGGLQPNLITQHRGKILFHIDVFRFSEESYWILTDVWEGVPVGNWLHAYHIREDFEMKLLNPDWVRFDGLGPLAATISPHPDAVMISSSLGMLPRTIHMIPTHQATSWLESTLCIPNVGLVGFEAFNQIRINEGVPRAGIDYTDEHFPQEASLHDHISYTKGCYIGQETHARMFHRGHPNWKLVAVRVPVALKFPVGSALFLQGESIGTLSSLSGINHHGKHHGIARIKYQWVGPEYRLAPDASQEASIEQFPLTTASS